MITVGRFGFTPAELLTTLPKTVFNPYVIAGLLTLIFSMGLHLITLSRVDISFAYPFLSISYVVVLVAGYYFFGERINMLRIFGIALICLGTLLIAQS